MFKMIQCRYFCPLLDKSGMLRGENAFRWITSKPRAASVALPEQTEGFSAFQTSPDLSFEAFPGQAGSFMLPR